MSIAIGQQILASDILAIQAFTCRSKMIVFWDDVLANIPSGWVLCDGNNGTRNALDKFPKNVPNSSTNPGGTGGALSKTTSGHTHTVGAMDVVGGGTSSADAAIVNAPGFGVGGRMGLNGFYGPNVGVNSSPYSYLRVAGITAGGNTDTITDIRPPYIQFALIMKT